MTSKGGRPRKSLGTLYRRGNSSRWWARYRDAEGRVVKESTGTSDREEAERFLLERLGARNDGSLAAILAGKSLTFNQWADWFLEHRSKPPYRTASTHRDNHVVLKNLRPVFGEMALQDINSESIERYLRRRLGDKRKVVTKFGVKRLGQIKPSSVHKEFRILRRILNVAVHQGRLGRNPCDMVEFPARIRGTIRKPHYMNASEQRRIEAVAPEYLRNIIVIMTEMGLRPYRELLPIRKTNVDLANSLVHIPDSKTTGGIADMPMTAEARAAFIRQMQLGEGSEYLFPSPRPGRKPHLTTIKKCWAATLEKAGVPHFPLYEMRHTFATRLSAGGVPDHFVSQLLRQDDPLVFKRYSQAKLNMMREALDRMDRQANEHERGFGTAESGKPGSGTVPEHFRAAEG